MINSKAIASIIEHRPWSKPNRPWIMTQVWHNLLFAHWPLEPALLEPFISWPLMLDTFNPRGKLYRGDIHHPPWQLHPVQTKIRENSIAPVTVAGPAVLSHYAKRQDVLAWALTTTDKEN